VGWHHGESGGPVADEADRPAVFSLTGNTHDVAGQSTRCHRCGALLIERDWYQLGRWRLDERGRCAACGEPCAGVFDGAPGRWGARRLPIRLRD
jgi:pyruvate formate lyase activating enzyme